MSGVVFVESMREAEQCPGVHFTTQQKTVLAKAFDDLGVQWIEHPLCVSGDSLEEAKMLLSLGLRNAHILPHIRCHGEDLEVARRNDIPVVAMYMSASDIQLQYKLRMTREEAAKKIRDVCGQAGQSGIAVERLTLEDATRADPEFLVRCARLAEGLGARAVGVPDTCGASTPARYARLIAEMRSSVKIPIQVHCHNDLGLAAANCLAAFEKGATQFSTVFNGLGERVGCASTQEVATALHTLYGVDTGLKLERLSEVAALVEKYSGVQQSSLQPVTGRNAFTHKGGTHQAGVARNPATYEVVNPELVGGERDFSFGELSGRNGLRHVCETLYGLRPTQEQVERLLAEVKRHGHENGDLLSRDIEFARIISRAMDVDLERLVKHIRTEEMAVVHIHARPEADLPSIAKRIKEKPYALRVFEVTGQYDMDILIHAPTTDILNSRIDEIRGIEGIHSTQSHIVLKAHKHRS